MTQPAPHLTAYGHHHHPHGRHPEAIFVNAPSGRDTSINKVTVPVIMAISAGAFLVAATYAATSQFSDIKHSLDKLVTRIESLSGELTSRVQRLEQGEAERRREGWTQRDQELWCARTEQRNAGSGFRCSEFGADRQPTPPPPPTEKSTQGWRPAR